MIPDVDAPTEIVGAGLDVEYCAGTWRVDPVRRNAEGVTVYAVGLEAAGCLVCPILPILPIFEPRPAAEKAVLFGVLIIEAIRKGLVEPVIRLARIDIIV